MKKDDLIRKLERARMPEINIAGHRAGLKQALLTMPAHEAMCAKSQPPGNILQGLEGLWSWLREPVWKAGLASALSVFLVAAVLAVVFYVVSPSPAVVAADVVKKDPVIQQSLSGTGEIYIVRVIVKETTASVVCGRGIGDFMEAEVDVNHRVVLSTKRFEGLFMQELPLAAQDDAVKIAWTDPRVREMLDRGGKVGKVFPVFTGISRISMTEGNVIKVTPTSAQAVVPVTLEGRTLLVQVNLDERKAERVIESQKLRIPYSEYNVVRCSL
jgi:hypothetical protein